MAQFSKTTHESVKGKCKWAHVTRLNRYDEWSVELWPIPEDLERIREWQAKGLKNTMRKDDDGYNIRFKRPPEKKIILRTGEIKYLKFDSPSVAMADGSPLPQGVSIGNGSDVTVLLEVYTHGVPGGNSQAVACRLEGIRVDNLVPFEPGRDYTPEEKEKIDLLTSQPEHLF